MTDTAFIALTPSMRAKIETTIENLIALLDAIDGDPDLEDDELEDENEHGADDD